jgi:hypothetical protein
MDHRKDEGVAYLNGQSEAQKLSSMQPLFCLEIEFSSKVNFQNSLTSKPLSGHGRMNNR